MGLGLPIKGNCAATRRLRALEQCTHIKCSGVHTLLKGEAPRRRYLSLYPLDWDTVLLDGDTIRDRGTITYEGTPLEDTKTSKIY